MLKTRPVFQKTLQSESPLERFENLTSRMVLWTSMVAFPVDSVALTTRLKLK